MDVVKALKRLQTALNFGSVAFRSFVIPQSYMHKPTLVMCSVFSDTKKRRPVGMNVICHMVEYRYVQIFVIKNEAAVPDTRQSKRTLVNHTKGRSTIWTTMKKNGQ